MMTLDEFKYKLDKLLSKQQPTSDVLSLCESFLVGNGYRVSPPIKVNHTFKLTKYSDLVKLFYDYHSILYGTALPKSQNEAADNKIASNFVKSRQTAGGATVSKERALQECALIIETVINNLGAFGFDRQIGFWIFGTDSCRWITDKALDMIETERKLISDAELDVRILEYEAALSDEAKGIDIDRQFELVRHRGDFNGKA